jgi:hypothetical protein
MGKQRKRKGKGLKKLPVTEMDVALKDSMHGRRRKEREILRQFVVPIPEALKRVAPKPQGQAASSSAKRRRQRKKRAKKAED